MIKGLLGLPPRVKPNALRPDRPMDRLTGPFAPVKCSGLKSDHQIRSCHVLLHGTRSIQLSSQHIHHPSSVTSDDRYPKTDIPVTSPTISAPRAPRCHVSTIQNVPRCHHKFRVPCPHRKVCHVN